MQFKLTQTQCFTQILLHAGPVYGLNFLLGAEEMQARGFLVAQAVHGSFSLLQQLGGRAGVRAEQGGANISLQRHGLVVELVAGVQAFLKALSKPLDQQVGQFNIRGQVRHHDDKVLGIHASHGIAGAHAAEQALRNV